MAPPFDAYINPNSYTRAATRSVQSISLVNQNAWSKSAYVRLSNLAGLGTDWDSHGSDPVTSKSVEEALRLISVISRQHMPEPKIFPVSGGGLQFEWHGSDRELEIEVLPSGAVEYLISDASGRMIEGPIDGPEDHNALSFVSLARWFLRRDLGVDDFVPNYASAY